MLTDTVPNRAPLMKCYLDSKDTGTIPSHLAKYRKKYFKYGRADNGGETVQPELAGPLSTKNEAIIIVQAVKNSQYESILRKGEAISLAPSCNGIKRLLNVPLSPAVSTKNTIIVP